MSTRSLEQQVALNIARHDRIAAKYEARHGEIFNDVEQNRLRAALERARALIRTGANPFKALDVGCGSGNLTGHLLDLECSVVAADVSTGFLDLVRGRFRGRAVEPFRMNGRDLSELPDASFDVVAAYSVLHHIPDYLAALREFARICKPGGIVFLDHEMSERFWQGDPVYEVFRKEAFRIDWKKYFTPGNYLHRLRRVFDPRHANEGDIHVWPDDHIEWREVTVLFESLGFEVVLAEDYLLYRKLFRREVFERFRFRCSDTRLMVFRRS